MTKYGYELLVEISGALGEEFPSVESFVNHFAFDEDGMMRWIDETSLYCAEINGLVFKPLPGLEFAQEEVVTAIRSACLVALHVGFKAGIRWQKERKS